MKSQTKAIHTPYQSRDAYNALSMPVYHCAAFEFDDADSMSDAFCGRTSDPDYSRVTNPTVIYFENKIKSLTGASDVMAFNSGMAAISATLMALAAKGKNIVTSPHLFANTFSFLNDTLNRFGVEARLVDLTDPKAVKKAVDSNTCCLFLEIITNPQMEIADLSVLAEIAHSVGAPLVADTTLIPFTQFDAHSLGVDVEIVSSTKYISGGATSLGGLVIDYGHSAEFTRRLRKELLFNLGGYMTPHPAYMQTVGLETLQARYSTHAAGALALAHMLEKHPAIKKVNYPGLPSYPYHELCKRQFGDTFGAMMTIELDDREACFRFINNLRIIRRATNLFDNRSLAIHPASTIFGNFSPEERAAMDVSEAVIRLSIGLEDPDDLYADISQALDK